MSTRSRIGYLLNGVVKSVYCHYDGYPEYNGQILEEFYKTFEDVKALVDLGDISSLGETTAFRDEDHENGTRDYFRWRGEPIKVMSDYGIQDYFNCGFDCGEDYLYLFLPSFDENGDDLPGTWEVAYWDWDWFRPLNEVLGGIE